jgi:hypothetical protein
MVSGQQVLLKLCFQVFIVLIIENKGLESKPLNYSTC